jgi:hypothetical protein
MQKDEVFSSAVCRVIPPQLVHNTAVADKPNGLLLRLNIYHNREVRSRAWVANFGEVVIVYDQTADIQDLSRQIVISLFSCSVLVS